MKTKAKINQTREELHSGMLKYLDGKTLEEIAGGPLEKLNLGIGSINVEIREGQEQDYLIHIEHDSGGEKYRFIIYGVKDNSIN